MRDVVNSNKESIGKKYPSQTILYLDTGSITRGKIDSFQEYGLSKAPSRAKRLVKNNDIVYSTVRPIQRHYGFIVNPPKNLVVSTGFAVIETKVHHAEPLFIYYFLTSDEIVETLDVTAEASTSAYPSLKPSDIETSDILLPTISKQRAIASILSSLDDKIDLLHRQNQTLEAMVEALFRQWFVEEADEGGNKCKLEDFVEVLRGLSYKGAGLTEKGNGIPMHNLNSIYEGGGYKYEGIKYYSAEYKETHQVYVGDIIITNTEQGHDLLLIGYPAIVPTFFGETGIFSQHFYRLKILNDKITAQYLYYLLMSFDIREQITGATNGSTVNMLPKDGIEWVTFQLPPKYLIEKYSRYIQDLWEKKELIYMQIRTLEKLRDTLLPKLMRGEVRVEMGGIKYED